MLIVGYKPPLLTAPVLPETLLATPAAWIPLTSLSQGYQWVLCISESAENLEIFPNSVRTRLCVGMATLAICCGSEKVFFNDLESDYRFAFHTCLQARSMLLLLPSYNASLLVCSVQSMDWHILFARKEASENFHFHCHSTMATAAKILATIWTRTAGYFPCSRRKGGMGNKQLLLESHFSPRTLKLNTTTQD